MSNVQIPNLPAVAAVGDNDLVEAVQAGVSVKESMSQIAAYVITKYPYPLPAVVTSWSGGPTGLTPSTPSNGDIILGGTLLAGYGGTGIASYAVGDILYADTTTTLAKLADVATGNALISGGVGVAPSWGKIDLTTAVTGVLPVSNGGTGLNTILANGVLIGNGTGVVQTTAVGSTGQVLVGNTGAAPTWANISSVAVTTISFGTTGLTPNSATAGAITVAGILIPANGGTGFSTYAVGDILYANTTTSLAKLADVATGSVLISGGVGVAPSWATVASQAVSSISFGTTGLTPNSATQGAVVVAGTLIAANGGTGIASYAVGDLLYAGTTTTLSKLADVATGSVLVSGGISTAPAWSSAPSIGGLTVTTAVALFQGGLSEQIVIEKGTNTASAATGTIQMDGLTNTILAYTTASTNNFTLNLRASSGATLNSIMANGDRITFVFEVTNTGTPHVISALTVDGAVQTVKWANSAAPAAGNASSIDRYTFTVNKTASATYTVTGSLTPYG